MEQRRQGKIIKGNTYVSQVVRGRSVNPRDRLCTSGLLNR
jgi:hypothetical protein